MGGMKRKRSFDLSSPTSSTTSISPSRYLSLSPSPTPPFSPTSRMQIDSVYPIAAPIWHHEDANTRTRKRWRDNRPDEGVIHENTLDRLFAAQRSNPLAESIPLPQDSIPKDVKPAPTRKIQATLHSFWNIPRQIVTAFRGAVQESRTRSCGKCGWDLGMDDGMDDGMDVDGEDARCTRCSGL